MSRPIFVHYTSQYNTVIYTTPFSFFSFYLNQVTTGKRRYLSNVSRERSIEILCVYISPPLPEILILICASPPSSSPPPIARETDIHFQKACCTRRHIATCIKKQYSLRLLQLLYTYTHSVYTSLNVYKSVCVRLSNLNA